MCWPSFGVDIGHQGGVSVRTKYSDSLFVVPFMRVFSVCMLSVACAQMVRVRGSQAGLWFPCVSVGVRHRSWFFFTARPKPDLVSFFFTTRPKLDLVSPSQHDRGSPLPQSFSGSFFTVLDPNSSRLCSSIPCKASFWKCGSDIVQKCGNEMNSLRFKVSPSS